MDNGETTHERRGEGGNRKRPVLLKGGRKFMRDKLQGKTFLIPSCITVVGIFCGFLAIVSAFKGQFKYATQCIAMAFILDGLDGRVARRLNATSAFGREFDSLSDIVAFGVAPAVLTYCWCFAPTADEFGVLVAFLFVVCGATRLARFNVTSTGEMPISPKIGKSFQGLPIPGAAAALISFVYYFPEPVVNTWAVLGMMIVEVSLAGLMVSNIPYMSLKHLKITQGNPRLNLFLIALVVALIWKFNQVMLLVIFVGYAYSGLVAYIWQTRFPKSWERQKTFLGMTS